MRDFYRRRGKRACDLVLGLAASLFLAPVAALVAAFVYITLGRPILFKQRRVGLDGRIFTVLKFRTMEIGEFRFTGRSERSGNFGITAAGGGSRALPDADRLTPAGELLRRSSLDEIPQLVNVLRGEMSLVGPRPLLPEYLPRYTAEQAKRHDVMPGVTGLAQVSGRNAISWDEKFALDVRYVRDLSLALDARILARTLLQAIHGSGTRHPGHATMPEFQGTKRG